MRLLALVLGLGLLKCSAGQSSSTSAPTVDNIEAIAPTNPFCAPAIYTAGTKKPIWTGPTDKAGGALFCTDSKTDTTKQCTATQACVVTKVNTNPIDQQQTFSCVELPKCCPDQTAAGCQPSTTTAAATTTAGQ